MKTVKIYANPIVARVVDVDEKKGLLDEAYRLIDCSMIEIVHAVKLREPYVMIVDEEGMFAHPPRLNFIASILYGIQDHGSPIVGNAIIMKDVMTDEGRDIAWLTDEEAQEAFEILKEGMKGTPFEVA